MFSSYKKNGRTYMNYFIKFVICYAKTYVWFELHITFWESLDLLNTDKKNMKNIKYVTSEIVFSH